MRGPAGQRAAGAPDARLQLAEFRRRCSERGLAVTHQRQVIFETLAAAKSHPSPEEIYRRVRRRIPAISLGTVYKSIKTFLDAGLIREVNPLHETVRLDANLLPHHHRICLRCRTVSDLPEEVTGALPLPAKLADGFSVASAAVLVFGICPSCDQKASSKQRRSREDIPCQI